MALAGTWATIFENRRSGYLPAFRDRVLRIGQSPCQYLWPHPRITRVGLQWQPLRPAQSPSVVQSEARCDAARAGARIRQTRASLPMPLGRRPAIAEDPVEP